MRARMAIAISGVDISLREVVLRDKPAAMLEASPKGTVPVVVTTDGNVLEESLDVMRWALAQNDPENWLSVSMGDTAALVARNDGPFKAALDRYKYGNRYADEDLDVMEQRAIGAETLHALNIQLEATGGQLLGPQRSFADVAIFPFIRQFANTDREWFDSQPLPHLQAWLAGHLDSDLFKTVMKKYPKWQPGDIEPKLPTLNNPA